MSIGMLWFDNSPLSLREKIKKAADYYEKKYGRQPDLCLVHARMLTDTKVEEIQDITVRPSRFVLPGHLWIGVEDPAELVNPKVESKV